MCWSPTVTLFFVFLELLCLAVLRIRRGHWALVVGAGGLWLQELIQLLLWWEIEKDEARGGSSCSASNERLTLLELFTVVGLVPSGFAIMAIWSMESLSVELRASNEGEPLTALADEEEDGETLGVDEGKLKLRIDEDRELLLAQWGRLQSQLWGAVVASLLLAASTALYFWYAARHWGQSLCTVRGPVGGHQLWPWCALRPPPSAEAWAMRVAAGPTQLCERHLPMVAATHACRSGGELLAAALARLPGLPAIFAYVGLLSVGLVAFKGETLRGGFGGAARGGSTCGSDGGGTGGAHVGLVGSGGVGRGGDGRGDDGTGSSASGGPRVGRFSAILICCAGPGLIVPGWLVVGAEYGSVWCWAASTALLGALAEPRVIAWATRRHARRRYAQRWRYTEEKYAQLSCADQFAESMWSSSLGPAACLAEYRREVRARGALLTSRPFARLVADLI